jgi:DNA modification methylase
MVKWELKEGDCLKVMEQMIKDGIKVHSVVTDPPYHLTSIVKRFGKPGSAPTVDKGVFRRSSTGFMGKEWDGGDIAFRKETWELCHELLHPGGHLLAFAATKNYHRMACAIEDAGFEIRDQIGWLYGCLSEDTKIITPYGSKTYDTIKTGDLVLCFDKYTKEYSYQPVEEIYEYQINDTAYRIQSDYTDQIVSRNHRVLIEREGKYVFCLAEETREQETVPYLENLSELQYTLSVFDDKTDQNRFELQSNLHKSNNWEEKFSNNKTAPTNYENFMQSLWERSRKKQKEIFEICRKWWHVALFETMQRISSWARMGQTWQIRSFSLDGTIKNGFNRENDRINKSRLERWDNEEKEIGQLQRRNIDSLSFGIQGNDAREWIYSTTSIDYGKTSKKDVIENGSGSSYRSRSTQQSIEQSDALCEQSRPQIIRGWKGHKTTLATITPIKYKGIVWCVKVPTGCFVAKRNDKVFVTGNSGFPKSHDISKDIDKMAGVERKVVGERKLTGKARVLKGGNYDGGYEGKKLTETYGITEPTSEDAKKWSGWGTALKPAWEPICVARKPLDQKTIARNVLEHGTGAINIDNCRIDTNELIANHARSTASAKSKGIYGDSIGQETHQTDGQKFGRWPANVIHDGSDEVVDSFPNPHGAGSSRQKNVESEYDASSYHMPKIRQMNRFGDNGSAARFFYSAKVSKEERNGSKHPTLKPVSLMSYLVRLVTPKGGTVLDPFSGTGTTLEAAYLEEMNSIGIERDPEYVKDILKRMSKFAGALF